MGFSVGDVLPFTRLERERERLHLLLIDDARRGLVDIAAGRTFEADSALRQLQEHRAAAARAPWAHHRHCQIKSTALSSPVCIRSVKRRAIR